MSKAPTSFSQNQLAKTSNVVFQLRLNLGSSAININFAPGFITEDLNISLRIKKTNHEMVPIYSTHLEVKSVQLENWLGNNAICIKNADRDLIGVIFSYNIFTNLYLKVDEQLVNVTKFRSIKLPASILKGDQELIYLFPLQEPSGLNIGTTDPAYLKITYNASGKLVKASFPAWPISFKDKNAPVLVKYHNHIYSVPLISEDYERLVKILVGNNGTLEIDQPAGLGANMFHSVSSPSSLDSTAAQVPMAGELLEVE